MRVRKPIAFTLGIVTTAVVGIAAHPVLAKKRMVVDEESFVQPSFALAGDPVGGARPPAGSDLSAPASLAGGNIAALADGALVIDPDSGDLVRVDRDGKATARVAIAAGASQLVLDRKASRAYVADRNGDHVVVVDVGDKLAVKARWQTPAEPFGLALTPDAATLLVTTVADRTLVALDTTTGKQGWQRALAAEPRGVAISPDGTQALVTHLTSGTLERIDLRHPHTPSAALAITAARRATAEAPTTASIDEGGAGRTFPRNAFAARFVANAVAIVPHQESTPLQDARFGENTGSYGGGFESPINHAVTFIAAGDRELPRQVSAQIALHQPNALAWDPSHDRVAIAGFGSDSLLVLDDASQAGVRQKQDVVIPGGCGPMGVAFSDDGDVLVFCALTRTVARVAMGNDPKQAAGTVAVGSPISETRLTAQQHEGYDLFRKGNDFRISSRGSLACAGCHPEGRDDGLSWRIETHQLQTPLLVGRVAGTHPYKWDGSDATLPISLTSTMRRLGGAGLRADEVASLAAYLEQLPRPRTPTRDATQVARGKKLFESSALGCSSCHAGTRKTDRERHELDGSTLPQVDTPSLIGLSASAPYYHDGSAATLEALLGDRAIVHGMADMSTLDDAQIADLTAFLETL